MNPIALYLASGESLYPGALLLLLALFMVPLATRRWSSRLCQFASCLGMLLMLLAFPPLRWWAYAVWLLSFVAGCAALSRRTLQSPSRLRRVLLGLPVAILSLLVTLHESFHRQLPAFPTVSADHLVVLGDSISAGIDPTSGPWPVLFQQLTHVPVRNLALPGIGVAEAETQARKVSPDDTMVLLEIGGNDLLANLPAAQFRLQLEQLLSTLDMPGRTLVMFELPGLPHKIEFGTIQRELAERHHVYLIPKRYFIHVMATEGATSDGLHLSLQGANAMANLLAELLSPMLHPPETPATSAPEPRLTSRPASTSSASQQGPR